MGTRGYSKQRIIETAGELFRRHGYHGTGLNRILAESHAPRGSFYFHFPEGKQQLAVEAVTEAGLATGQGIDLLLRSSADVGEAIGRVIDFLAADLRDSGYERGCPVATVALDAASSSERVRIACSEMFEHWRGQIADRLEEAGWGREDASDQAFLVLSAVEGALLIARARRDTAPLRAVASHLGETLSSAPAARPGQRGGGGGRMRKR